MMLKRTTKQHLVVGSFTVKNLKTNATQLHVHGHSQNSICFCKHLPSKPRRFVKETSLISKLSLFNVFFLSHHLATYQEGWWPSSLTPTNRQVWGAPWCSGRGVVKGHFAKGGLAAGWRDSQDTALNLKVFGWRLGGLGIWWNRRPPMSTIFTSWVHGV